MDSKTFLEVGTASMKNQTSLSFTGLSSKPLAWARFVFLLEVLLESGDKCIRIKLLDSSIGQTTRGGSKPTFMDLEERYFEKPTWPDHAVSGSFLSYHSIQAIHYAYVKQGIDSPTKERDLTLLNSDCQNVRRRMEFRHG